MWKRLLPEWDSLSLVDEATEIIFSCVKRRVDGVAITSFWRILRQIRSEWRSCDVGPHIDCFISSLTCLFPFCIFGGYCVNQLLRSALDSIHQNHLGREGLRWNDGQLMTCYTKWKLRSYDNMPTYPDDLSVLFVWEIASKLFTQEMVSINLLFDCSIVKHFTQFYADISRI